MLNRVKTFFMERIWSVRIARLPKRIAFPIQICRVLYLTLRFFIRNKCALHASALTFFSLLSIVPIAGLLFGIAKGYGFEQILKAKIQENMIGQEQTAQWIIQFADNALKKASGGVVAGVGVILLIWTALKLLTNIETSFNDIWGVKRGRSLLRKLSDYLTMLILCPLLLVVVVTSSAFLMSQLQNIAANLPFSHAWNSVILILTKLFPFFVAWCAFTFLYIFIPNTRVTFRAGLISGAVAGIIYTLIQFGYMYLQKHLTGYNAIYGSFAAVPFFLIWLQISWSVILFGAQTAFAVQNVNVYELSPGDSPGSIEYRSLSALRIMTELAHAFERGTGPVSGQELSERLEIPIRTARAVLYDLCSAGIASRLLTEAKEEELYQCAIPPAHLTPVLLFRKLGEIGGHGYESKLSESSKTLLQTLWKTLEASPENKLLTNLPSAETLRKERKSHES